MRAAVLITILVLGSGPAVQGNSFLNSIGDFFKSAFNSLEASFLPTLEKIGAELLTNATHSTSGLLAEAGQMLLFELGQQLTGSGKRDIVDLHNVANAIQKEITAELGVHLNDVKNAVQKVLKLAASIAQQMTSGQLSAGLISEAVPVLKNVVQTVEENIPKQLVAKIESVVTKYVPHLSDPAFVSAVEKEVKTFLAPLLQHINIELHTVVTALESLAQNLLRDTDLGTIINKVIADLHLLP